MPKRRKVSRDTRRVPARYAHNGSARPIRQTNHSTASKPPNQDGKVRLLTREALDGRTRARRVFDNIARGIAADLGGPDQLSTVQKHLVEAFAGAAIHVHDINAHLLLGEKVDIIAHSQAISVMVRVASRIGIHRVAKTIGPTLGQLLREEHARQLEDAS